jgi:hypothetical protein
MKQPLPIIFYFLTALLVFSFSQTFAQENVFDDSVLSENGKQAYQTLLKMDTFAIGGIGYGGSTSKGEEALIILLKEKEAISALKELAEKALPEGGLYGIFGLKVLKCDCFNVEFEKFINKPELGERKIWGGLKISSGNVHMMSGCLGFAEKRVEVAEKIKSNEFDSYIERHFK